MIKPKFTDSHKYPHGYRRSEATDISATFRRIKAQQEKDKQERTDKLRSIHIRRTA